MNYRLTQPPQNNTVQLMRFLRCRYLFLLVGGVSICHAQIPSILEKADKYIKDASATFTFAEETAQECKNQQEKIFNSNRELSVEYKKVADRVSYKIYETKNAIRLIQMYGHVKTMDSCPDAKKTLIPSLEAMNGKLKGPDDLDYLTRDEISQLRYFVERARSECKLEKRNPSKNEGSH